MVSTSATMQTEVPGRRSAPSQRTPTKCRVVSTSAYADGSARAPLRAQADACIGLMVIVHILCTQEMGSRVVFFSAWRPSSVKTCLRCAMFFSILLCCAEQCCMLIICVDRSLISFHCILFLSFVPLSKRVFRLCFIRRHLGPRVSHE